MAEVPVTIRNEGQQIVGMLHQPENAAGRVPAVLFFHGFTGNMQEPHRIFVQTARRLAQQGVLSLRFDFRGSGDSEGDFVDVTISSEVSDAHAALAFLRARPEVDPERIGLVAMSLGGLVAAEVLGSDRDIKAAALWCAVADTLEAIRRRASRAAIGQMALKRSFDMEGWEVGRPFARELASARPLKSVVRSSADFLLVHGEKDESVPVEDVYAYEQALRHAGRDVTVRVLKGAGHTFDSVPWVRDVVSTTTDWLADHL